ncbi:MAG: hypothetical protein U0694_18965 [Anaerolineae bacterium]
MTEYPRVVLFGSISGGWREKYIIPVLEEYGITYYNPVAPTGWTTIYGDREAELMAHCETIVIVINKTSAAFTSLAESGWAALGAAQRGQHFILQIDLDYMIDTEGAVTDTETGRSLQGYLKHWSTSSRYLVYKHAQEFRLDRIHLVNDMDGVIAKLRQIYGT